MGYNARNNENPRLGSTTRSTSNLEGDTPEVSDDALERAEALSFTYYGGGRDIIVAAHFSHFTTTSRTSLYSTVSKGLVSQSPHR